MSERAWRSAFAGDPGRFWVHLDVDVLDEVVFPATDYLMPGGLDLSQLADRCCGRCCRRPALVGVSVGCYNPEKDPDEPCGEALVELFRNTLVG